jgi:hypothetical protein
MVLAFGQETPPVDKPAQTNVQPVFKVQYLAPTRNEAPVPQRLAIPMPFEIPLCTTFPNNPVLVVNGSVMTIRMDQGTNNDNPNGKTK